jgi:hypothetical protein
MNRIWTLTLFLIRELFGSVAGIVPLAVALAFGLIAFEYGMDQAQFITVAGVGTSAICLLCTLLLASRMTRAWSYPLIARLHRRAELLVALVLGGLATTAALAALMTVANLAAGRLTLDFPSVLWILPTWLAAWSLAAALALPLSALTSRGGSHIAGYVLLTTLLVLNDQKARLQAHGLDWLIPAVAAMLWPVTTLLGHASAGVHDRSYYLAFAATLVYATLLFALADQLFQEKDLLWAE